MSFWLRAASLPDRPPMAVNLLSIDVIFLGGHRRAVRSVQQFWGLRACARSAGARARSGAVRLCGARGWARNDRPRGALRRQTVGPCAAVSSGRAPTRRAALAAKHCWSTKRGGVGLTGKGGRPRARAATFDGRRAQSAGRNFSGRQLGRQACHLALPLHTMRAVSPALFLDAALAWRALAHSASARH